MIRWAFVAVLIISLLALSVVGNGTVMRKYFSACHHATMFRSTVASNFAMFDLISEPPAGVTVTCGDYVIEVSIEKALHPSLEANRLRLYYSSSGCQAVTQTSTHLYVSTSLQGCGTLFLETGDSLVFSNVIVQDAVPLQGSGFGSGDNGSEAVITRDHDFDLPFECSYSRKKILSLQFVPEGRVEIPGVGMV